MSNLSDNPGEFIDTGHAGPDEPEPIMVGDVHLWGVDCPCGPAVVDFGTGLRHHSLDGTNWTEDIGAGVSR